MELQLKTGAVIVGFVLGLSACAPIQERKHEVEARDVVPVEQPKAAPIKPTQLIAPSDVRVAAAMNEALPTIVKVLGIQRCVADSSSLRLTNVHAVSGVDMSSVNGGWFPNQNRLMPYHNKNNCISVSTLDKWTMPALNALQFRIVFFADDSGETTNFQSLYKKMDDGSWKIAAFYPID